MFQGKRVCRCAKPYRQRLLIFIVGWNLVACAKNKKWSRELWKLTLNARHGASHRDYHHQGPMDARVSEKKIVKRSQQMHCCFGVHFLAHYQHLTYWCYRLIAFLRWLKTVPIWFFGLCFHIFSIICIVSNNKYPHRPENLYVQLWNRTADSFNWEIIQTTFVRQTIANCRNDWKTRGRRSGNRTWNTDIVRNVC